MMKILLKNVTGVVSTNMERYNTGAVAGEKAGIVPEHRPAEFRNGPGPANCSVQRQIMRRQGLQMNEDRNDINENDYESSPESLENLETRHEERRTPFEFNVHYRLDPRYVSAERLSGWIFLGVVTMMCLFGVFLFLLISRWAFPVKMLITGGTVSALFLLLLYIHFWPRLDYRNRFYLLNAQYFEIRQGVIWKQWITVPLNRMQHVDVDEGPIERMFRLAHLVIHTAGTVNASVVLKGLNMKTAVALRDFFVETASAVNDEPV